LRRAAAYGLLSMITLNTTATLTAIFLVGFDLMKLSDTILIALIGETIAHVAAMSLTVVKYLFPTKQE
jgi:hypothetical protein